MLDWKKWLAESQKTLASEWAKIREKLSAQKTDAISSPNITAKKEQHRNIVIVGGAIIAAVLLGLLLQHKDTKPAVAKTNNMAKTPEEVPFTSPTENLDEQSVWIERAGIDLNNQKKNNDTLKKVLQKQASDLKTQNDALIQQQQRINQLGSTVNALTVKIAQLEKAPPTSSSSATYGTQGNAEGANAPLDTGMSVTTLALAPIPQAPTPLPPKTPGNYVPSGSYVKAVMLGGLDASTGVNAQSNPRPVFLRTTDDGTLPNGFHSHLKNCRLIGAGYGDLSSERAYVRLESMSCMRDGVIVDFPVYGYVNGKDGKDGIRGSVVMRDGELVSKAFVGGALSGFGDSVSDNYTTTSISPLGSTTSVNNGQSLEYGAAQGVSNAADLYAQYNIKRAEQLQPVIEVSAGNEVDIVFTKGFYLDGLTDKQRAQVNTPTSNTNSLANRFSVSTSNAGQAGLNPNNSALFNQIQQVNRAIPQTTPGDAIDNNAANATSTQPLQGFP